MTNTRFSHSLNPAHRDTLIKNIQADYDRFSLETFQCAEDGSYPPLGAGIEQPVLDWLYPATHLLLSPRAGREQADRDLARIAVYQ